MFITLILMSTHLNYNAIGLNLKKKERSFKHLFNHNYSTINKKIIKQNLKPKGWSRI